jgi:hypothetical protein
MKFIILVSNFKEISASVFSKLFVEEKAHGTNQNIDGFYMKTTQKGGFSKLCVKIKKDVIPTFFRQHLSRLDYIFFEKKTDMKFITSVSNLKEISSSVFS